MCSAGKRKIIKSNTRMSIKTLKMVHSSSVVTFMVRTKPIKYSLSNISSVISSRIVNANAAPRLSTVHCVAGLPAVCSLWGAKTCTSSVSSVLCLSLYHLLRELIHFSLLLTLGLLFAFCLSFSFLKIKIFRPHFFL